MCVNDKLVCELNNGLDDELDGEIPDLTIRQRQM